MLYLVPRLSLCSDPHAALAPQSSILLPLQGASSSHWLPRMLASARELWAATLHSMPLVGLEDKQLERLRPWGWLSRCLQYFGHKLQKGISPPHPVPLCHLDQIITIFHLHTALCAFRTLSFMFIVCLEPGKRVLLMVVGDGAVSI